MDVVKKEFLREQIKENINSIVNCNSIEMVDNSKWIKWSLDILNMYGVYQFVRVSEQLSYQLNNRG